MSDLLTSVYLQMISGINSIQGVSSSPAVKEAEDAGASTVSFQEILTEQMEDLQELLQTEEEQVSPLEELRDTLDKSILGNRGLDLQSMSEEMLYSSGGSSVVAQLMEGHFASMVTATSEAQDNESYLSQSWNTGEQSRTKEIEELLTNMQKTINSIK